VISVKVSKRLPPYPQIKESKRRNESFPLIFNAWADAHVTIIINGACSFLSSIFLVFAKDFLRYLYSLGYAKLLACSSLTGPQDSQNNYSIQLTERQTFQVFFFSDNAHQF